MEPGQVLPVLRSCVSSQPQGNLSHGTASNCCFECDLHEDDGKTCNIWHEIASLHQGPWLSKCSLYELATSSEDLGNMLERFITSYGREQSSFISSSLREYKAVRS